jgi:CheY-like chemotaxis protein
VPIFDRTTILVVDDHAPTRQAYAALLEDCGYHVLEAVNGSEAILLVRQFMPDAVLMDIAMPVVTGIQAAESLRADPLTAGTPILGVTGSVGRVERERMAGVCNHLLVKPCSPAEILMYIGSLAKGMGSRSAAGDRPSRRRS